jgi:hypothetical protein
MADDTKPNETSLALLNAKMDSRAREVGALDRDDPKRADLVKEIFRLSELAAEMRREEKLRGQTSMTQLSCPAARSSVWPYHLLAPDRSAPPYQDLKIVNS